MDSLRKYLFSISRQYRKTKKELFDYSDRLKDSFNLPDVDRRNIAYGIIKTNNPDLQKFVDILNNDKYLERLNNQLFDIKMDGIIKSLLSVGDYIDCIPGYDINKIMKDTVNYQSDIIALFEGLAGVNHIHIIDSKTFIEIPAREYLASNPAILKNIDYWYGITYS
ncbi:hypothetical protein ACFLT1_02625 [Bacteroidota bacterium]